MTDRVEFSIVSAVQAATPSTPPEPRDQREPEDHAPPEPQPPEPIALDVQRGEDGVFVYTLSDPATGRLISVIPESAEARTAGNYASGGWVSLTA